MNALETLKIKTATNIESPCFLMSRKDGHEILTYIKELEDKIAERSGKH